MYEIIITILLFFTLISDYVIFKKQDKLIKDMFNLLDSVKSKYFILLDFRKDITDIIKKSDEKKENYFITIEKIKERLQKD